MRSTLDLRIFVWTITSAHVVFQIAPCAVIAQGPLPPGFTYQGHVKNGGSPVNGTADFEFSLWNSYFFSNPENQIGTTMSISNVAVSNGLFMVTVNSGNEFGPTPFNGDARWLQIAVRSPAGSGSFTTLSPRQQLLTVPYAG